MVINFFGTTVTIELFYGHVIVKCDSLGTAPLRVIERLGSHCVEKGRLWNCDVMVFCTDLSSPGAAKSLLGT